MSGILPRQAIERLVADGAIAADGGIAPDQLQPASLDLRLGSRAHRIRASFLPAAGEAIADKVERVLLHTIDLNAGAVLETGCVYLVPLMERLALPPGIAAATNPKSSTGRLDVFTRVIADGVGAFDVVPAGYRGALAVEIAPRTFPVLVRAGSRLSQVRFRRGDARLTDEALIALHARAPLATPHAVVKDGLNLTIDLSRDGLVGYRAKRHTGLIDVDRRHGLRQAEFWDPIGATDGRLILDPDEFYILTSREAVSIPPDHAAEMVPFDPLVGEFRVHYAGFFDPGFGWGPGQASRAVLEVRSREVPFILEHGQVVARLAYERMDETPDRLYGAGIASNYQAQALKLSKHFRD